MGSNCDQVISSFLEAFEHDWANPQDHGRVALADALILFLLYFNGSAKQRGLLLYELLRTFDPSPLKESETVALSGLKDIVRRVYEFLAIPIPFHQVSDSIDLALYGEVPCIIEASLSTVAGRRDDPGFVETYDLTSMLSEISLVNLHIGSTRSILLNTEQLADALQTYFKDMSEVQQFNSTSKLTVKYSYKGKRLEKVIPIDYAVLNTMLDNHRKNSNKPTFLFFDNIDTRSEEEIRLSRESEARKVTGGGLFSKMKDLSELLGAPLIEVTLQDHSERISQATFLSILQSLPVMNWALNSGMNRKAAKKYYPNLERAMSKQVSTIKVSAFARERPLYSAIVKIGTECAFPLQKLQILKEEERFKLDRKEARKNWSAVRPETRPEFIQLPRPIEYSQFEPMGGLIDLLELSVMSHCQERYDSDHGLVDFFRKEFQIPEIEGKDYMASVLFHENAEPSKVSPCDSLISVLPTESISDLEIKIHYFLDKNRPLPPVNSLSNVVYFRKHMMSQRNGFQRAELIGKVVLNDQSKELPNVYILRSTVGDHGKPDFMLGKRALEQRSIWQLRTS